MAEQAATTAAELRVALDMAVDHFVAYGFFVLAQTITRTFVVACISTAVVIIAEELPRNHRGWGIGILGAIGSFGYGLGALLYAFIDVLPFGWRSLYLVGGIPLLLMPRFPARDEDTPRSPSTFCKAELPLICTVGTDARFSSPSRLVRTVLE